jgi:signal transduction histidine kinase
MRERLGRVGGKLMIQSAAGKTILQAVIPLAERPIEGDYC